MNRAVDILLLGVACYLVYFGSLDRHAYIQTESLRTIVVREMLERDGWTMPTVHHTPYVNKPPLYAWTMVAVARETGEFNEQIARMPSAIAGTLFILLMYGLGERWVGRGAGLVAATFSLLCPTITDYAVRAELDLPFSFLCVCNIVLTFSALRARGWAATGVLWIAAYALALVAAMWKGPHSLIFMWLAMFGYAWVHRDWGWLRAPLQWIGLAATLGVLIWWTQALSAFAGSAHVGKTAAIELLARLVPHRVSHLFEMVTFIPLLIVLTLPLSVLVMLTFRPQVRALMNPEGGESPADTAAHGLRGRLANWWSWMREDSLRMLLAAWIVPCLIFMLWAPGKAPRYSIPIFPPILLLGTMVLHRIDREGDEAGRQSARRWWRAFFGVLAICGLGGLVGVALALANVEILDNLFATWQPWAFLAVGGLLPLLIELRRGVGRTLRTRSILTLAAIIASQPVVHDVWWPRRVAAESQRETADKIDALVPDGARLFVLGDHECHDVAIYADTPFEFAASAAEALRKAGGVEAIAIYRANEADELLGEVSVSEHFHFERADKDNVCATLSAL